MPMVGLPANEAGMLNVVGVSGTSMEDCIANYNTKLMEAIIWLDDREVQCINLDVTINEDGGTKYYARSSQILFRTKAGDKDASGAPTYQVDYIAGP